MSEFKQPQRITIPFVETLRKFFGEELVIDIEDGRRICSACGGLGIMKADWKYGVKDDPDRSVRFGYKEQFFYPCPNCFTGVVNVCPHCNSDIPKPLHGRCNCDGAEAAREQERIEKEKKIYDSAKRIEPESEAAQAMGMFYYDGYPYNNGYFVDFEEFIEWWEGEDGSIKERSEYVWGTTKWLISIDANDIIESVCDDLCEEAAENISHADTEELQAFLNSWCAKQFGTTTYEQDTNVLVRVPWEEAAP